MAFNATVHGKNACDGIGASIKSNARRASLRKVSDNYILAPQDLYQWATKYFKNILCFLSSKDKYVKITDKLRQRLDSATTRTQSFHCVRLLADTNKLEVKRFWTSEHSQIYSPVKKAEPSKTRIKKNMSIVRRPIKIIANKNKRIKN